MLAWNDRNKGQVLGPWSPPQATHVSAVTAASFLWVSYLHGKLTES